MLPPAKRILPPAKRFDPEPNPFAAPTADLSPQPLEMTGELTPAEVLRLKYLGREASVKSIGSLYILGGNLSVLGGVTMLAMSLNGASAFVIGGAAFSVLLASFEFALGLGLQKLKVWARWTAGIMSGLSLVYVLVASAVVLYWSVLGGVLVLLIAGGIAGYMFYLLVSPKSSVVFSPPYKLIILQTPHIKYKTSPLLVVFVLVLFALLVFAFLLALR